MTPVAATGWPPSRTPPARLAGSRTVACPDCPHLVETSEQLKHHAALWHGGPQPARQMDSGDEVGP